MQAKPTAAGLLTLKVPAQRPRLSRLMLIHWKMSWLTPTPATASVRLNAQRARPPGAFQLSFAPASSSAHTTRRRRGASLRREQSRSRGEPSNKSCQLGSTPVEAATETDRWRRQRQRYQITAYSAHCTRSAADVDTDLPRATAAGLLRFLQRPPLPAACRSTPAAIATQHFRRRLDCCGARLKEKEMRKQGGQSQPPKCGMCSRGHFVGPIVRLTLCALRVE